MWKLVVLAIVLAVFVMPLGCIKAPAKQPSFSATPIPNSNSTAQLPSGSNATIVMGQEPPADRTWISPGKVEVGNFYPGARAVYYVAVHNGKSEERWFNVSYRYPDYVADGFSMPPPEAQFWVIVVDGTFVLAPRETRNIDVILEMPNNVVNYPMKWEFWISVMDKSQTGMVVTELCSRWLITMR